MAMLSRDLGVDLGTMFTRIAEGSQIVLSEPTVVAVLVEEQKMVEYGQSALNLMGRVKEDIEVTRPLRNGVVAYYEYTHKFLQNMIERVVGKLRLFKPQVMITHPYDITSVERRAVHEAALEVLGRGANVLMVPQTLSAALSIDLPIGTPSGNMVIIMGGGCTQVAVLAMNDTVSGITLREGGMDLDEAIMNYIRRKYGLIISPTYAEQIKLRIGAAVPLDEEKSMDLQGQDQVTGLPRPLSLTTNEVVEALDDPLDRVFESIRVVLEKTPPELASDIIDRGIALCGGGALLSGIDKLMTQKLGIPTYVVDDATDQVALGAIRAIELYPILERNLTRF